MVRFDATPNPNALKCVPGSPIGDSVRSYFRAEEAASAGDPLAVRLFALPGVTNVLIHTDWVTVCKAPDAAWGPIKEGVRAALASDGPHGT